MKIFITAYAISVVAGGLLTWAWSTFLFRMLAKSVHFNASKERVWWVPMLLGVFERAIVTTLIIFTPKIVVGFIGGWVLLKTAGGWGRLKDDSATSRSLYMLGLLGSVVSLAVAILAGLYVAPGAITLLNTPN